MLTGKCGTGTSENLPSEAENAIAKCKIRRKENYDWWSNPDQFHVGREKNTGSGKHHHIFIIPWANKKKRILSLARTKHYSLSYPLPQVLQFQTFHVSAITKLTSMDFPPFPSRYSLLKLDLHGNQLSATVEVGLWRRLWALLNCQPHRPIHLDDNFPWRFYEGGQTLLLLLFAPLLSPCVHLSSPALTNLCLKLAWNTS